MYVRIETSPAFLPLLSPLSTYKDSSDLYGDIETVPIHVIDDHIPDVGIDSRYGIRPFAFFVKLADGSYFFPRIASVLGQKEADRFGTKKKHFFSIPSC